MTDLLLEPAQARVLAALVEKSITTPQYYPMTINAIMIAANQKNARHPVMTLSEGEVGAALNQLETERFVSRDDHAGRVPKWRQRFAHQLLLKPETTAVLATLMLRGPLTVAELRSHAAILGGPGEADAVSAALDDLADRAQPLVCSLPRAPGQAATRWAHRLCGEPAVDAVAEVPVTRGTGGGTAWAALEARVAALEARLAALESSLGVAPATD